MTAELPTVDRDALAAASHGSWCPKLCNHACPVLAATGRDDAVPWSFHRTLTDLAHGSITPDTAAVHLQACTGCLACRVPCVFDQDVPDQVRAGRASAAAAGAPLAAAGPAVAAVDAGRSPFGVTAPYLPPPDPSPTRNVLVGCRDEQELVDAAATLYAAAGVPVAFVAPDGCCGSVLHDLGAATDADRAGRRLRDRLDAPRVVVLDPHCLPSVAPAGMTAEDVLTDLDRLLDDGQLTFTPDGRAAATYHDPCLLARGASPVVDAPRRLLAAAGFEVVEPEGTRDRTVCTGAGLGFELVDPPASEVVAARRRRQLAAAAPVSVTACSGARRRLAVDGSDVHDLLVLLATRVRRDRP